MPWPATPMWCTPTRPCSAHDPRGRAAARSLEKKRFSMSLFLIYFGTKRRHPHLAHHNVLFGPRYRELLRDIFDEGVLADDFSLYLHAPTVSDPTLAPEGCEAFYVLSPVPHLGKGGIDWTTEGPRYADRILDYLEARYIPHLRADLVTKRIFTPLDFEHDARRTYGLGLLAGARADTERLVPRAQPRRPAGGSVLRGRRHPSRCRCAGRREFREGDGRPDARRPRPRRVVD